MRLFDVRPLRAVMRGVDCSGHMKALQSIWTTSSHYCTGLRHRGGLADFMKGVQDLMMEATAKPVTLLTPHEDKIQRC